MINVNLKLNISTDKKELNTIISNAIFLAIEKDDNRKLKDMTLWELNDYLPSKIADEIIKSIEDFIKINAEPIQI